jgi:hypothetical protein
MMAITGHIFKEIGHHCADCDVLPHPGSHGFSLVVAGLAPILRVKENAMTHEMSIYRAAMIADQAETCTDEEYIEAWQLLVDTRVAWQLQDGSIIDVEFILGETAAAKISEG